MDKRLRNSVAKALKKLNEAECAVQVIETHLTFSGFRGDEPCVSVCNGGELYLNIKGLKCLSKKP